MFRIQLALPAETQNEHAASLVSGLAALSVAQSAMRQGSYTGDWILEWLTEDKPEMAMLETTMRAEANTLGMKLPDRLSWDVSEIDDNTDWLAETYRAFPPFSVGPFFIYGSHYGEAVPEGQMGLQIDAATAFGSGEHGTTKGCLQAMLDLKGMGVCPWNILDMGTGSGILAIAAWKLWKTPILAVDIDAESVRVTDHHAGLNGVKLGGSCLSTQTGDGFAAPLVDKKSPYELVIANILAGPVIDFAADLAAVTDKPGYAILSGMLVTQAADVLAAYEAQGFALQQRYDVGEWSALLLTKR